MARPSNVSRVVINGSLPDGESFAWGFWMDSSYATQAATQLAANTIASFFNSTGFRAIIIDYLQNTCSYLSVDVYSYPTAGQPAQFLATAAITGGQGTGTSNALPLQVALCVTTLTGQVGRRRRGRLYLPITTGELTLHQLAQADINEIVDGLAAFFAALNGSANVNGTVCVMSVTGGFTTPINQLSGDSRLDIQRRRAADQDPLYTHSIGV